MSSQSRQYTDATRSSILQKVDTKFAVFPAAFIALRIWRSLQIAVLIYNPNRHSVPDWIKYALALLSVSSLNMRARELIFKITGRRRHRSRNNECSPLRPPFKKSTEELC